MKRYCLQNNNSDYFLLNNFFNKFKIDISEYNWVIGEILNMMVIDNKGAWNDIIGDNNDYIFISGQNFEDILKQNEVYVIFSMLIAVPKSIKPYRLVKTPFIDGNEEYYKENYESPVPEALIEIGFCDSADIIFTLKDQRLEETIKSTFPDLKEFKYYDIG
ncbi:hypothetical protein [Bacillus atrophaeus]|uniref:hypothetical protein n=1 Tax=Bacillus atrophaeus TaxID=1452 RepID=UPI002E22F91F|nr:hypothetical protein [Bacillus atrophaeus]MED4858688.1 hypothetical protein [Bacillus atrophaeus]